MKKTLFSILLTWLLIIAVTHANEIKRIPFTDETITVDGIPDDIWENIDFTPVLNIYGGNITDSLDFSASWKAMWDEDNLYFLFRVVDNELFNLGSDASKFWIHDCVELFFDMLNDKDTETAAGYNGSDNYQYRFIWNLDDEVVPEEPPMDNVENVTYTNTDINNDTTGYYLEIKYPWSTLIGEHPFGEVELGKAIGLEIKVADLDASEAGGWSPEAELLWSNPTDEGLKVTANFGTIILDNYFNDTIAPSRVSDLKAEVTGSKTVDVTFTAAGDDDTLGIANSYDFRFNTDSITETNWVTSGVFDFSIDLPENYGEIDTVSLISYSLEPATNYYVGMKVIDESGNASVISNLSKIQTLEADNTAPAKIEDLTIAYAGYYSVKLTFKASGDDDMSGYATNYEIRYSDNEITEANWGGANLFEQSMMPKAAGETETVIINDLEPEHEYYFAIKAIDEVLNYSPLSNVVNATLKETSNSDTTITMGHFIGTNSFIDVPMEKMEAVGFIREYHNRSWNEPAKGEYRFYHTTNGWDFDEYYRQLREREIVVVPCIQSSPAWLRDNPAYIPIEDGEEPTDPQSYTDYSKLLFQMAARYGSTTVDESKLSVTDGQEKKTGLGYLTYYEDWNEQNRTWDGDDGYFEPEEYAAMASASADGHEGSLGENCGLKKADPNAKLVMGGIVDVGTEYIEGMRLWFEENRSEDKWPIDVINFHHYSRQTTIGITPEEDNFKSLMLNVVEWRDMYAPDNEIWLTEFGYDTNDDSPSKSPAIGKYSQQEVQSNWIMRTYLIMSSIGINKAAQYMIRDVYTGSGGLYGNSGFTEDTENDYTPKVSWYQVYTFKNLLKDFYFDSVIEENDKIYVYKYSSNTKDSIIYALWSPTSTDAEYPAYKLSLPHAAYQANLLNFKNDTIGAEETELDIVRKTVTLDVDEKPKFVVISTSETVSSSNPILEKAKEVALTCYPVPSKDEINIEFTSKSEGLNEMVITDVSGKTMYSEKIDVKKGTNHFVTDINQFQEGIYFIIINTNDSFLRTKFIKE